MGNGKIQNIGVKRETLDDADKIYYECRPSEWQMFDILVSFCKDCPNEFTAWKKNKLEKLKEKWKKQQKKSEK